MSGAPIVWPVRPFPRWPAALPGSMPSCRAAAGHAARSLKSSPMASGSANVHCCCRCWGVCARRAAGRCWWHRRIRSTAQPGRPGESISRAWRWSRRAGRAMRCGRPSMPWRAARWGRCCAGRRTSMPAQVRRLQVAAAGSDTLAFLFRPLRARGESSAAALRLSLSAGARGGLAVDLIKRRGPSCTRTLHLEVPRPLKWRADHEPCQSDAADSALAGTASAPSCARSQRPLAFA